MEAVPRGAVALSVEAVGVARSGSSVEWHAVTLDDLEPNGQDIVEIEGPADSELQPDGTPYR